VIVIYIAIKSQIHKLVNSSIYWQLFFYKPNLWWPNGMGKQSLYNVEISVDVKGLGESDAWSHYFGFRKIESTIDGSTGGR
jgi:mannosylglycoprotein endo-beta-mannosidase